MTVKNIKIERKRYIALIAEITLITLNVNGTDSVSMSSFCSFTLELPFKSS